MATIKSTRDEDGWDPTRNMARSELYFSSADEELYRYSIVRARRLGMSLGEYVKLLMRAVMLMDRNDSSLLSLLGVSPVRSSPLPAAAPAEAEPAPIVEDPKEAEFKNNLLNNLLEF